jgi:hypothetical protein
MNVARGRVVRGCLGNPNDCTHDDAGSRIAGRAVLSGGV